MRYVKMINKYRYIFLLLIVGLGFGFYNPSGQQEEKDKVILNLIYQVLNSNHFSPQTLNDDFSEKVFDNFLESLDFNKRFLLAEDVEEMEEHRLDIDDQVRVAQLGFFENSYGIYKKRYLEVKGFYQEILTEPFDLEAKEYYETDDEKLDFAENTDELKDRWRKYFKFRVLNRIEDMMDEVKDSSSVKDSSLTVDKEVLSLEEMEAKAREKESELHEDWFKSLDDMERMDWLSAYLNAITLVYDPHTQYFAPEKKEDFEINMTGQLQGIGAQLSQKGDYVTISKVLVGSPCWKQGDLEVGDKILKVEQEDGEIVDLVGLGVRKAVTHIRGPKGTEVLLTVRKMDGTKMVIPIIRDIVELESTFAKSSVIGEGNDKVGYIRLPKFYVNFYGDANRDCAEDIAKELEKLKAENVNGIILDLRNNGGGSLQSVIDIVGLFIDEGPVVQVKASGRRPQVLRDRDKGLVYDGPLVVMVNQFSASASEIFAAAIQDYKRGLIIGSQSTFGKGTVQNIVDMDRAVSMTYNNLKPLGALKLTIQKYYRINGGTPQLKGVTPDIILPDNYMYIPYGEKEQDYALPYDEIDKAEYDEWEVGVNQYPNLVHKSKLRIDTTPKFSLIEQYARWIKDERENSKVSLNLEIFREEQRIYREEAKKYKGMRQSSKLLTLSTNKADIAKVEATEDAKEKNENWHKALRKDLYLVEAVQVLNDLSTVYGS
jgi:carboxyl-terminal processing protease